ncbi:MAG: hypothetical protein ACE5FL_07765 [Myxococcota bacterium]
MSSGASAPFDFSIGLAWAAVSNSEIHYRFEVFEETDVAIYVGYGDQTGQGSSDSLVGLGRQLFIGEEVLFSSFDGNWVGDGAGGTTDVTLVPGEIYTSG